MLLSQVIRGVAITGRTDAVGSPVLGRQGGRWAHQWVDSAFPDAATRSRQAPPPAAAPGVALQALEELRRKGDLTDAEFERLRAKQRV
jgi:putative intracellular protease/amidase